MTEIIVSSLFEGSRLDRFIGKSTNLPSSAIQRMIRKGDIKLNGKKAPASAILAQGDVVRLYTNKVENRRVDFIEGLPSPDIIYEDDFIMAVNKPPFLASQPDIRGGDCLSERIKLYLKEDILSSGVTYIPGVLNRLDMNTSGIVLCGKTAPAAREMSKSLSEGKILREYVALVKGKMKSGGKMVNYALSDEESNKKIIFDEPREKAVRMESVFTPLKVSGDYTLVKARLITGKQHQIRAQLAHIGCPVVGDIKYGVRDEALGMRRQALHCYGISFTLWYDSSRLKLKCEPPRDMLRAMDLVGLGNIKLTEFDEP